MNIPGKVQKEMSDKATDRPINDPRKNLIKTNYEFTLSSNIFFSVHIFFFSSDSKLPPMYSRKAP